MANTNADTSIFLKRPEVLAPPAMDALLDPTSGVSASDLDVSVTAPGTAIAVPTAQAFNRPGWKYFGHARGTYAPIDFEDLLGTYDINLSYVFPITTVDIINTLNSIFQLNILESDVVVVNIPQPSTQGGVYVLKAKSTSTMWKGQRTVRLYQN